jgi:hypothetical protein
MPTPILCRFISLQQNYVCMGRQFQFSINGYFSFLQQLKLKMLTNTTKQILDRYLRVTGTSRRLTVQCRI